MTTPQTAPSGFRKVGVIRPGIRGQRGWEVTFDDPMSADLYVERGQRPDVIPLYVAIDSEVVR